MDLSQKKKQSLSQVVMSFHLETTPKVVVALPLVPEPPSQRIFAFLPVRSVGFRFAVQATRR